MMNLKKSPSLSFYGKATTPKENTMRHYNYSSLWKEALTPSLSLTLSQLHEYKGRHSILLAQKTQELSSLEKMARIQSVEGSNRIEGISTSNERLNLLMEDKTTISSRDESELMGYRNVLATIHDSFSYIPLESRYILHLHKDLYKPSGLSFGGTYKIANNIIQEIGTDGEKRIRFQPVEAWQTLDAISTACEAYNMALPLSEPLILIPMFILDFLCIHPFSDGNGRMSRLLTLLLFYRSGFFVGKYVSIEKLIEKSKETYYEALQKSSTQWHENQNQYLPFIEYILGILLQAYREFDERVEILESGKSTEEQVKMAIETTLGKVPFEEILLRCPNLSEEEVTFALKKLEDQQMIQKITTGELISYVIL